MHHAEEENKDARVQEIGVCVHSRRTAASLPWSLLLCGSNGSVRARKIGVSGRVIFFITVDASRVETYAQVAKKFKAG